MTPISVAKTLVLNQNNELLILHIGVHTERPERSHTPDLPGGLVEEGETEKNGAVRELMEETGISLDPSELTFVHAETSPKSNSESVSFLVYMAKLNQTPEVKVSWEHESYEWIPVEQVNKRLNMRPHHQRAIGYVLERRLI